VNRIKFLICVLALSVTGFTYSDTVTCKNLYLKVVSIQGDRDDNMGFANHLILSFKDKNDVVQRCAGAPYVHLSLNHQAVGQLHANALAAKMANSEVFILVNTNDKISALSNQLSAIGIQ
jgi:hypothetical protein